MSKDFDHNQEKDANKHNDETFGRSGSPNGDHNGRTVEELAKQMISQMNLHSNGMKKLPIERPSAYFNGSFVVGSPNTKNPNEPFPRPILKTPPKTQWEFVYSTAPPDPNHFHDPVWQPDTRSSGQMAHNLNQSYNDIVESTQEFARNNSLSPTSSKKHVWFDIDKEVKPQSGGHNSAVNQFMKSWSSVIPPKFDLNPLLDVNRDIVAHSPNHPGCNWMKNLDKIWQSSAEAIKQGNDILMDNMENPKLKNIWNYPLNLPFSNPIWPAPNWPNRERLDEGLDKMRRFIRDHMKPIQKTQATYTWSGQLPRKPANKTPIYSCKVFLGGIPYDLTDSDLHCTFAQFGHIQIQWPGKDIRSAIDGAAANKAGYVYIIFETYDNVSALLNACTMSYRDMDSGPKWYFNISSRRQRGKEVQVIPFDIGDRFYMKNSFSGQMEHSRTVFVGACHGMLSAEGLARVLDDLFGGVVFAGLDTDKYKYPLGSARVSFDNQESYAKAISAAFVEIKSAKFKKKIQIDPYIENEKVCSVCRIQQTSPIFCRNEYLYFCAQCWEGHHSDPESSTHRPIIKNKPSNA